MSEITVTNWFGNVVSHPQVVVDANSVDDIVRVLQDTSIYPSPVRAVGSNHSTSPCGAADGGTLIRMKMNQVLNVTDDTLTVQAGALHIDLAKMLEVEGAAVLYQYGDRQLVVGERGVCGYERRVDAGRAWAGGVLRHWGEDGIAERGVAGGNRRLRSRT